MSAEHEVAAFAQALREQTFHALRAVVRHRVQMLVQPGHKTLTKAAHHTCRLDACLVILESLLRRQARHADVVTGTPVSARIPEVDDVDRMMTGTRRRLSGHNLVLTIMAEDNRLKSAVELAMERLRQKDAESGETQRTLTDAEKSQIAEIRNFYDAKLAEQHVLHQSRVRSMPDPGAREALEAEWRQDKERLTAERDRKIQRVRDGHA